MSQSTCSFQKTTSWWRSRGQQPLLDLFLSKSSLLQSSIKIKKRPIPSNYWETSTSRMRDWPKPSFHHSQWRLHLLFRNLICSPLMSKESPWPNHWAMFQTRCWCWLQRMTSSIVLSIFSSQPVDKLKQKLTPKLRRCCKLPPCWLLKSLEMRLTQLLTSRVCSSLNMMASSSNETPDSFLIACN